MTPEERLDRLREVLRERLGRSNATIIEDFIFACIEVAERNKP